MNIQPAEVPSQLAVQNGMIAAERGSRQTGGRGPDDEWGSDP